MQASSAPGSLYAMRVGVGFIKVGRSSDVPRRSRQLCARVLRVWPGLGYLEPSVHRFLERFRVSREVFDCPLEAVELVVEHAWTLDAYIKQATSRLHDELDRICCHQPEASSIASGSRDAAESPASTRGRDSGAVAGGSSGASSGAPSPEEGRAEAQEAESATGGTTGGTGGSARAGTTEGQAESQAEGSEGLGKFAAIAAAVAALAAVAAAAAAAADADGDGALTASSP
jgi:hypothetical protein